MSIGSYIAKKWIQSPADAIQTLYWKWLRVFLWIVGGDFLDAKFTYKKPYTIFGMCVIGMWVLGPIYTAIYYEENRIQVMPYMALGIQGMSKYLTVIRGHKSCKWICSILALITKDISQDKIKEKVLKGPLTTSYLIFFVAFLLYSFAFLSVGIVCVAQMIYFKKLICFTPVLLPFNNEEKLAGFLINSAWVFISVIIGTCGSVAGDVIFLTTIINTFSLAEVFKIEFGRYSEKLITNSYKQYKDLKLQLNNLIRMHQDILSILAEMNVSYQIMTNCFFATCPSGIIFIIYIQTQVVFIPGYLFLGMFIIQLFIFCALGTALEIINDTIYNAIYDCSYYKLEIPEQKVMLIMLFRAQKYKGFKYGAVNDVNLPTFVQVMKTVYSFTTLLVSTE